MKTGRCLALCLAAAALLATVAASPVLSAPRSPAASLSGLESSVLAGINVFRARHGLARLGVSVPLTLAARAHSRQMAADGYFAHSSADGTVFWKRLQRFYPSGLYRYWSVGENLLWRAPSVAGSSALALWLASPEHRANLLDPRWREIGVSALHVAHAPGVYHGLAVTIVTTDFGVRQ